MIIPTYNRAHLISESITSIVNQEDARCDIELIVVDDGSTDNTEDVVRQFGPTVKYIRQENSGAGAARNKGIAAASGEWISFLDSDDLWLPYKLSLQFKVLDEFPHFRAIHSNFYTFSGTEITIENGLGYWLDVTYASNNRYWSDIYSQELDSDKIGICIQNTPFKIFYDNIFAKMSQGPLMKCDTLLVHRTLLGDGIRFSETYPTWEDYWFACKLSEEHDLIFLDVPTLANRDHGWGRLTDLPFIESIKCHLDVCEKIYFTSHSNNRPSAAQLDHVYELLLTKLFKDYLKTAKMDEAREILGKIKRIKSNGKAPGAHKLYEIACLLPPQPINFLRALKRRLS